MPIGYPPKMTARDIYTDGDGLPLVGTPLGRRQIELDGIVARETCKRGKLLGWYGRRGEHPILEYPDGTREVVQNLTETNWKHG